MKEITQALLDWHRLYDWAAAQPRGSIVGKSCANGDCPMVRYLEAQTGQTWSVGSAIKVNGRDIGLQKPDWVERLIVEVDLGNDDEYMPVTREQFLRALKKVKEGSGHE